MNPTGEKSINPSFTQPFIFLLSHNSQLIRPWKINMEKITRLKRNIIFQPGEASPNLGSPTALEPKIAENLAHHVDLDHFQRLAGLIWLFFFGSFLVNWLWESLEESQ